MDNQIPEPIKTQRSNELITLCEEKMKRYENLWKGQEVEVLVEEPITLDGQILQVGHTKEYIKVAFPSETDLQNQLVTVKLGKECQIIH